MRQSAAVPTIVLTIIAIIVLMSESGFGSVSVNERQLFTYKR